jgi:hypothetical protein
MSFSSTPGMPNSRSIWLPGNDVNHHWPPADSIPGLHLLRTGSGSEHKCLVESQVSCRVTSTWIGGFFIVSSGTVLAIPWPKRVLRSSPLVDRHRGLLACHIAVFGMYIQRHSLGPWTTIGSVRGHRDPVPAGHRTSRHRLMEPWRTPESG